VSLASADSQRKRHEVTDRQRVSSANVAGLTRVYIEVGAKRTFASAAEWPGWARSGKTEQAALETLSAYRPRYAKVVTLAKLDFPKTAGDFTVVERLKGNATTDFGAPGIPATVESKPQTKAQIDRLIALLDACWKYLDSVVAASPKELTKGPRGGGRDRDKIYAHVLDAELAYARQVGVKLKEPDRAAMKQNLRNPGPEAKWSSVYAIRRTAWHALDHAWEIEDRLP
jgi:hypothetical protein